MGSRPSSTCRWSAIPAISTPADFLGAPSACRRRRCPELHADREMDLERPEAAAETPALGGDPVEHGKIDVIKPRGQARCRPAGCFHHDLRMRDHGSERFDVRILMVLAK